MYLTQKNFLIDDVADDATVLYFFFDRGDISSANNGTESFGNLSKENKILLKIFTYVAHCADMCKVYLVYLEPIIKATSSMELSPQLRCMLTYDFCVAFVLTSETRNDKLSVDDDDFTTRAVLATKRLICVDANLAGTTDVYIMRNDPTKTMELISQYDFSKWMYDIEVLSNKKKGSRYYLDRALQQTDTLITRDSLFGAVSKYFKGCGDLTELTTDELLEFLFETVITPSAHPVYKAFVANNGETSATTFLSTRKNDNKALIFQYSMEQMINKDNFTLFENIGLISLDNCKGSTLEMCKLELTENANMMPHTHDFDLNWPHLKTFNKTVVEDVCTKGLAPMDALRVRTKLFDSTVLNNAHRFFTEPTRTIYMKINDMIGKKGVFGLVTMKGTKLDFPKCDNPAVLPKLADYMFLSMVFVKIMGLGRIVQAFLTLIHIFHSTAPKWKAAKIMIVNHTKAGMGKTHTMKALSGVIDIPGLFDSISSLTDTALKYSDIAIGKVILIDDMGLSRGQQKTSKREDGMLSAQFKSLLDVGYTKNVATEKDLKTSNFKAPTKIMVYNTAFVWNTNTMDSFTDALVDRCVILGMEPETKNMVTRPSVAVEQDIQQYHIQERFTNMYLRQHLIQSQLFVMCPEDCGPSAQASLFLKQVITMLETKFPTVKTEQSLHRPYFKLMDFTMGNAIRTAINTVTDWWIPPWTVAPKRTDTMTCREFLCKLEQARQKAFKCIDMCELLIEIMVHIRLFMPMSIVEICTVYFNQNSSGVFENVYKLISTAVSLNGKHIFEKTIDSSTDQPLVTINNYNKFKGLDKRALTMGKDLYFNRDGVYVRLVEDFTESAVKLNGFFAYELFKMMGANKMTATFEHCKELFSEHLLANGNLDAPMRITGVHKNILVFCHACSELDDDAVWVTADGDVTVSASLWGIDYELYLENPMCRLNPDVLNKGFRNPRPKEPTDVQTIIETTSNTFLEAKISWFSIDFVKQNLSTMHKHSRCGIVPCGDKIGLYMSEDSVAELDGWEHEEAMQLYEKYKVKAALDHKYMCHTSSDSATELMANDSYLTALADSLPKTNAEMLKILNARYSRKPGHIVKSLNERTLKHKLEEDSVSFVFKKVLTENGKKLLDMMRKMDETGEESMV